MSEKRRVLFVDDEVRILEGLRRMLHPLRCEWDMTFVESGVQALEAVAAGPFDVVVSDMRMPEMNGAELLREVMMRSPKTVRIILSGYASEELTLKSVGVAHQYLSKPCDADMLKTAVTRACALRTLLAKTSLSETVSRMTTLPSAPSLYEELLGELQSPNASIANIGDIIAKDIGMSAKILQLVNSAFFGLRREIANVARAVAMLGVNTIRALVLSIHAFAEFSEAQRCGLSLNGLWDHSMEVGAVAQAIAKLEVQDRVCIEQCFTAGLLQDAGILVLGTHLPEKYGTLLSSPGEGQTLCDREREIFAATHAEVGAYLLGIWALPDPIVEAVAFHHSPCECAGRDFTPLAAVHAAAALCGEFMHVDTPVYAAALDEQFLEQSGVADRLPVWREVCRKTIGEREQRHERENTPRR